MKVSVDSSFVYAVLKKEFDPAEQARAESELSSADSVHVPMVVLEELYRFGGGGLELTEARMARFMALQQFLLLAETMPMTKQVAYSLAQLWKRAADRGVRSTTVDTLAAREAVLVESTMLTCDKAMRAYLANAFGEQSVKFFAAGAT